MENNYSIVITTTSSEEDSKKIATALLDQKLAACIQVSQIKSYYSWKGSINIDDENILLIKSKKNDYEEIQKCIKQNHNYEVPEIIQIDITDGFQPYLNWIKEVTK